MTTSSQARRTPQANSHLERWVRTLRHELLDRTIICNEQQLRALLVEYTDQRAPHDAVIVVPIRPGRRIERHTTCSGLINEYRTAGWTQPTGHPITRTLDSARHRLNERAALRPES